MKLELEFKLNEELSKEARIWAPEGYEHLFRVVGGISREEYALFYNARLMDEWEEGEDNWELVGFCLWPEVKEEVEKLLAKVDEKELLLVNKFLEAESKECGFNVKLN